jgi:hypothetical protein
VARTKTRTSVGLDYQRAAAAGLDGRALAFGAIGPDSKQFNPGDEAGRTKCLGPVTFRKVADLLMQRAVELHS